MANFKLFNKREINTKFKDNRERFRCFNVSKKEPGKLTLLVITFLSIAISIVPIVYPQERWYTPDGAVKTAAWIFWAFGLVVSIGFEQLANYHFYKYSKIANDRNVRSAIVHSRINKGLRLVATVGWILSAFAFALVVLTDGDLSSIW